MKYGNFKYGAKTYGKGDFKFVFDRTINDVKNKTSKGYLNYYDLNRIGSNINSINAVTEIATVNAKTDYTLNDFINELDFQNLQYYVTELFAEIQPEEIYINKDFAQVNFENLNHFEKLLYEMYKKIYSEL